jgi:hypothetical protein
VGHDTCGAESLFFEKNLLKKCLFCAVGICNRPACFAALG